MEDKNLNVIELENNIKLPVIDEINYQNRNFILVGVLNKEETDILEDLYVYERIENKIVEIENNHLLEVVMQTFEERLKLN